MDVIPEQKLLQIKPNTVYSVRKLWNLEKPGQMREAVDILHAWVQKQPHFKKKDFRDLYLQLCIISCKGSIERAKIQLDKMCTLRTLLPQFFECINVKKDLGNFFNIVNVVVLPKLTEENYRTYICKFYNVQPKASQGLDFYRFNIIFSEYVKAHDIMSGVLLIADFSEANITDLLSKLNPIELRQYFSIFLEGYGLRMKGAHIISSSKFVEAFINLVKQFLSPKLIARISVHQNVDELHKKFPKEILPKEYGGEERSIKDLQAEWIEELSSEEHINYIRDMNTASTDEAYRQTDQFTEQCAGLPGTFRLLRVD